jgi:membrane protein implicated in regulation of membrane protease activity
MKATPRTTDFVRFGSEYLASPKAIVAFWGSLIGGIVSLALAVLLHGTRWEVACAAVGIVSLIDASLLRYLFEVKREIRKVNEWLSSMEEHEDA